MGHLKKENLDAGCISLYSVGGCGRWYDRAQAKHATRSNSMLRPSYAPSKGGPRESVFISGPLPQDNEPVCSPYIEACVAAAQESCDRVCGVLHFHTD